MLQSIGINYKNSCIPIRYYSLGKYSDYYLSYGQRIEEVRMRKVGKEKTRLLPFFIPHIGCPYICVFCNQPRISGQQEMVSPEIIRSSIQKAVAEQGHAGQWEVAYFGGSFTAIPRELQDCLLEPAKEAFQEGLIRGIRLSTRPDAITVERLQELYNSGVRTIELGVQTLEESMLVEAKRGHTVEDVEQACKMIREEGITLGIQLLPGLPGETWTTLINTAVKAGQLQADLCRIYPVIVIEDTELADRVRQGSYTPLTVEQAVEYSAFLKTYLEGKGTQIIRVGLQSTEDFDAGRGIVGGPYAPAFGELVVNYEWLQAIQQTIEEHLEVFGVARRITVEYPRAFTSKVRGLKNRNIEYFGQEYTQIEWTWKQKQEDTIAKVLHVMIDHILYSLPLS